MGVLPGSPGGAEGLSTRLLSDKGYCAVTGLLEFSPTQPRGSLLGRPPRPLSRAQQSTVPTQFP